jgi:hypothetical protein
MTLGSRYIELFPSSVEESDEAVSRGRWPFLIVRLLISGILY